MCFVCCCEFSSFRGFSLTLLGNESEIVVCIVTEEISEELNKCIIITGALVLSAFFSDGFSRCSLSLRRQIQYQLIYVLLIDKNGWHFVSISQNKADD